LIRRVLKLPEPPQPSFKERLHSLTENLATATSEVDKIVQEMALVAQSRQDAVQKLEQELAEMEGRESVLRTRIEALEKTPIPVAEHFATIMKGAERKSARRDYLLFGAGVLVTTAIALAIQHFSL
ncbi:MAG: hypothetical protein ACTHPD_06760, partial [Rhizomicrobium sp.]